MRSDWTVKFCASFLRGPLVPWPVVPWFGVAIIVLGLCQLQVRAQEPAATGGLEIAELEGTLDAIVGNMLKVSAEDGTKYDLVLTSQSTFKYSGKADPKFLRPGYMVRFDAVFDVQKGIAIRPVSEIQIFTPAQQRRMTAEQRRNETPGVYPIADTEDEQQEGEAPGNNRRRQRDRNQARINANRPSAIRPNSAQAMQNAVQGQEFKVVGRLAVVTPTKIRVQAGARGIVVDLNADTEVSVAAGDAVFCLPGDEVKVTGLRNAAQPNLVRAETVQIIGSQTLGSELPGKEKAVNEKPGNQPTGVDAAEDGSPRGEAARDKSFNRRSRTRGKLGDDKRGT